MKSKTAVLITGARAPVALHLARLFVAAGHRVVLVDQLKHPVAAACRLGVTYLRIPPFSSQSDAAGKVLCEIIEKQDINLVIPTCEEVLHLAALWDRCTPMAALFAPGLPILGQVHDKFRFIGLCNEVGLPTPGTHLITSAQDMADFSPNGGEMVFKPVWSRFGTRVLIRPTVSQLRQVKPTPETPWVAQEYINGDELCAYAIAQAGRVVGVSIYRGLVRAGSGAAVCFEPVFCDAARTFVERVVGATNWTGQISFDLIETSDGRILPLECNPRATSGAHFFTDGPAFSHAILDENACVHPDATAPHTVPMALWFYGVSKMARRANRRAFLDGMRRSVDVMDWPGDRIGWGSQLRSAAEFAGIAMRNRISLEQASTWGIEWNGVDQSSIS